MRADGVEDVPGRVDVVALEVVPDRAADLRLQHHHCLGALEVPGPVAGLGEVRVLGDDVGLHALEDLEVRAVLVEHDEVRVAARPQPCDEVLADEAGPAGE